LGQITAGDRFGVTGYGVPLSEAAGTFEQLLGNAFGWPAGYIEWSHDGVGSLIWTIGGATQTQTVGVGNGSATTWCSAYEILLGIIDRQSISSDLQRRRLDGRAFQWIGGDFGRRLDAHGRGGSEHDKRRAHAGHDAFGGRDHGLADSGQLHFELRQRDGHQRLKFAMDPERQSRDDIDRVDAR
jgi:hypothetical protein